MTHEDPVGDGPTREQARLRALILASAWSLALELALIRWISTEIRVFAYFKNLTLIACFFGLGLGFLVAGADSAVVGRRSIVHRIRIWWTYPAVLALCAAVVVPKRLGQDPFLSITRVLGRFNEMPLWTWGEPRVETAAAWGSLALLVLLFLVV